MNPQPKWEDIQSAADALLSQGIFALRSRPLEHGFGRGTTAPGNYLFSLSGRPMYIGEGGDLAARLRQQQNARVSTFYKNYLKAADSDPQPITAFTLQCMITELGRKEIEDFGIANIPTPLNRFQLDKRAVHAPGKAADDWQLVQAAANDLLTEASTHFWSLRPVPLRTAEVADAPGIYALWGGSPRHVIYIGESSSLRDRHRTHCTQTYFSALRRNVGTNILGFELHERQGKRRYFTESEERSLDAFLDDCQYQYLEVTLGRLELEERLIARETPIANRKGVRRTSLTF